MPDNERLDSLIEETLKAEIESVNVSDEEIEREWEKIRIKRKGFRYKKILSIVAIVILILAVINLNTNKSYSWKTFKIFDIIGKENKKIINEGSSTHSQSNINVEKMEIDINGARDIISFKFKELPYEIEKVYVVGDKKIIIEYITDKGNLELIHKLEGLETNNTMEINKDSNIEKIKINKSIYNYININDKITKLIWTENAIRTNITVYYHLTIEESKKIISELK
ncbi:hypothetical protein [Maledivibacter halophilus]|uniref:DUF4367 domain-containing protein n=1 Tax=Maledivibacter halophilus TaxID=36842 RepID=A0A1T5MIS2_9FIRM|nr:hypothetical protein [Maledivibacter halophilus]SKC87814.1 hypothetical protein SAMN02194393_04750 [Maledivibacter halophilus]